MHKFQYIPCVIINIDYFYPEFIMIKRMLILGTILVLTACSSTQSVGYTANSKDEAKLDHLISQIRTNHPHGMRSMSYASTGKNSKQLSRVFSEWVGTRYRLGGESKRGIDCSAFTQTAFEEAFGVSLPRSTAEQRYVGRKIAKNELKSGDLVFFRHNNHVGVYLGNGRFMHSSSSHGVMISSLDEAYWSRSYTQSRRVM